MMKLDEIEAEAMIQGIEIRKMMPLVTCEHTGPNALTVYYKKSDGELLERLIYRTDLQRVSLNQAQLLKIL